MNYHNELEQSWRKLKADHPEVAKAIEESDKREFLDGDGDWCRSYVEIPNEGGIYRAPKLTEAEKFKAKWEGKKICTTHESRCKLSHFTELEIRECDEVFGLNQKNDWHKLGITGTNWQLWTPPEPKRIPLGPEDIKQGDAVRFKSWPNGAWEYAQPAANTIVIAGGNVWYSELLSDYEIRSIGETEWRPCWKKESK